MNRKLLLIGGIGAIIVVAWIWRMPLKDTYEAWTKPALPSAMPYVSATPTPSVRPTTQSMPETVNLAIPFVPQAPHQIWDADHEEFCEEASTLMVSSYLRGDMSVKNPDVADAALQGIKSYEMTTFGHFEDTNAAETARILRDYFHISAVQIVADPTVEQIKNWLSHNKAVIVPAAGRQLGNPNFKSPGPLYHMLVIKGYTANAQFITNDPGTRKGADYIYDQSVIMNAMHDWNGGDVESGRKVVIVVG